MGMAGARTRISLRAHVGGGGGLGALLLVCVHAVTVKSHIGLVTERRSGGTEKRVRDAMSE